MASIILVFIVCYLVGSFPTSYLVVKAVKGVDIREHGSKNAGATNVIRVAGLVPGIITFIVDVLKGFLPVFFSIGIISGQPTVIYVLAGLFTILGHTFPVFLGFRGGKGVATAAGVFLALLPVPTIICLSLFAVSLAVTRYVSLSSIISAVFLPFLALVFHADKVIIYISAPLAIFVIYRHKENIKRLLNGTERKFGERGA
jgi:acyl phosphate:glycerol-3-phosphate acyltransferase